MIFKNHTPFPALAFWGLSSKSDSFHVVVLRQTFSFEQGTLVLAEKQTPLCEEDTFTGEPNQSSVLAESDLCQFKPHCDVLLKATAHAPWNRPARSWTVGLQIRKPRSGRSLVDKTLLVSGPSQFRRRNLLVRLGWFMVQVGTLFLLRRNPWKRTRPEEILALPIRYEHAYGGEAKVLITDRAASRVKKRHWLKGARPDDLKAAFEATGEAGALSWEVHEPNPIGKGFARSWWLKAAKLKGIPAPQIEAPEAPVTAHHFLLSLASKASGDPAFLPQGLGCLAKGWLPRRNRAGTLDEAWIQSGKPIPDDFDFAMWNGAPSDQQVPCPALAGDELIQVTNLCPSGSPGTVTDEQGNCVLLLELPGHQPYVMASCQTGDRTPVLLDLDTLHLDLEQRTLVLVWRTILPEDPKLGSLETCMLSRAQKSAWLAQGGPKWPPGLAVATPGPARMEQDHG